MSKEMHIRTNPKTLEDIKALQILLSEKFGQIPDKSKVIRYCLSYVRELMEE